MNMDSEEMPLKRYVILPVVLTALFLFFSYFFLVFNIPFVHFYPFYLIFVIIIFFSYTFFAAVALQSLITVFGLIGIVFIAGHQGLILSVEVFYGWLLLFIFSKYEKRERENKRRLDAVFEEVEKKEWIEELGYSKEAEVVIGLKERLQKYHSLHMMANQFTGTLGIQEILGLVLKTVSGIIKKGTIRIAYPNDDSVFIRWFREQDTFYTPFFSSDIEHDFRFRKDIVRRLPYKSVIVIPLWAERKIHSFIEITSKEPSTNKEEDLRMICIVADIASLTLTNTVLLARRQELVIIDAFTEVFNRRYFMNIFEDEMQRAKRYDIALSLLIIDIDFFKQYNDTYGHLEGDKILKDVARAFRENVREADVVARYGGEEFAVLLSMASLDNAYRKAEQIREVVESTCGVTVSIGVASADRYNSITELMVAADQALYKAKEEGRNKVRCAQF